MEEINWLGEIRNYNYDDTGLRQTKIKNGVTTKYYYEGGMLIAEETNNNLTVYVYDAEGTPIGMQYHGANYAADTWDIFWYEKNLQGDIVAVYNHNGTKLMRYTYDAWGGGYYEWYNGAENTAALKNPFMYRGYYYDFDLYLYRTDTRYYDCSTCRWINPDDVSLITATPTELTDKNLYSYCNNNPVMYADPSGEFPWHILIGGVAGGIIGGVSSALSGGDWFDIVVSFASGFASGALAASGFGLSIQVVGNGAISIAENAIVQIVNNKGFDDFKVEEMLIDGALGAITGFIGGPGKGSKHLNNLGKQTVKRTFNATRNGGLKAGLKEAGKAFSYYGKSTRKYYKTFVFKDIPNSFVLDIVNEYASKYQSWIFARFRG